MKYKAIPSLPGKSKPYVMAHRGNKIACPENTLAAFQKAFENGADILETDLHLTADHVFVCIHDATVNRTTNGKGKVAEMTLSEIKSLSASYGRPEFKKECIPTLAEVLEILPDDVALALELKTNQFLNPDVNKQLINQLEKAGVLPRCMVLSFSLARIQAVQQECPNIPIGWITLSKLKPIQGVQVVGAFWPILFLNPFYVKFAHMQNQAVCPLDPQPDSRLSLYLKLGCDAILTDDPGSTRLALKALKKNSNR